MGEDTVVLCLQATQREGQQVDLPVLHGRRCCGGGSRITKWITNSEAYLNFKFHISKLRTSLEACLEFKSTVMKQVRSVFNFKFYLTVENQFRSLLQLQITPFKVWNWFASILPVLSMIQQSNTEGVLGSIDYQGLCLSIPILDCDTRFSLHSMIEYSNTGSRYSLMLACHRQ